MNKGASSCCVGLITNHTGRDQSGRRNIDILTQKGLQVRVIFTPQHGFHPHTQGASAQVEVDPLTNIPLINWYHKPLEMLKHAYLNTLDVLIFDLQDSGMRYGYTSLLLDVMKAAYAYNKPLLILDRPNLLGCPMEGLVLGQEYEEPFNIPVPIRHGMTTGELAAYFNAQLFDTAVHMRVVPMQHYHRYALSKGPFYNVSPNLASVHSCHGYSFLGLLGEVAPFDIGIGTNKAFQCILLPDHLEFPKQKWFVLQGLLEKYGIESKFYRTLSKRKQEYCSGLALCVRDINNFSSFSTLLAIMGFFKKEGLLMTFSSHFDAAIGSNKVREFFEGTLAHKDLKKKVNSELDTFFSKAFGVFLYKPLPKIIHV
ncbi:MAG TPA: exo-beta-N-acetylmuramidase NamZ domain-containing protein, partial [Candidatus Limnocylindria bacterium]|nr:exo-beta-N-acetylmuramidase NamZ domain-containing protein [Candidatus Limnocylindria bacterium]